MSRAQLEGDEYNEALRVVKAAFGALPDGQTAPAPQLLELDDLPVSASSTGAARLVEFGRVRGVGAISDEHELRFLENGLTIIYGQNAAGKTSYVRALKRVCRTVDCDAEVRGNVYEAASRVSSSPSASAQRSPREHRPA